MKKLIKDKIEKKVARNKEHDDRATFLKPDTAVVANAEEEPD